MTKHIILPARTYMCLLMIAMLMLTVVFMLIQHEQDQSTIRTLTLANNSLQESLEMAINLGETCEIQ